MANSAFFSDRTRGPRARDLEYVSASAWTGLLALMDSKIEGDWLAASFPDPCPDGTGIAGTNRRNLFDLLQALVHGIEWPPPRAETPDTAEALDLVEFIGQRLALPIKGSWHDYFRHHELSFDHAEGRTRYRAEVNEIFARTGLAFELDEDMKVQRLGPPEVRGILADLRPDTGDSTLDDLIREARRRYLSRDPNDERLGLEKLWDAFERIKTIEPGADKRAQVTALLDRVASGRMRVALEDEAIELTKLGNELQIRHFETNKTAVNDNEVDHLFTRMCSFMLHVLRSTDRLAK